MPYRHAHWYILALFPLAGLAFWQNYLSQLATSPMQFHLHGVTAALWLMLLGVQSWTIHHGKRQLHCKVGTASLLLFPLFMAGGMTIFLGMAERFVDQASPFYTIYAPRLAWLDVVGVSGFAYFYHEALRQRRKVHPHAGYLLSTVFFLMPPILGRLGPILPPLAISGPQDFWKLGIGFQLANGITAALAFYLAARAPKDGRPFFMAGALILLSAFLYQTVGGTGWWMDLFSRAAGVPAGPLALSAGVAGVLIAYSGWTAGRRSVPAVGAIPN